MKIELKKITIQELSKDYADNGEKGVFGYGGELDIRPPYQREFIYKDAQRDAVIHTVTKKFPLNVMYWAVRDDGGFEIIDGQQRTISVCQYVNGDFSYNKMYFHNLRDDEQKQILDYELMIYLCSGTDSEKLGWFKTINIAGEQLTDQELKNAVYSGPWVSDAKRYFSKRGCAAHGIAGDYMRGSSIRQDYLETAIMWISKGDIEEYMAKHQHDADAKRLWRYFQKVMRWVRSTFTVYRKEMKGVQFGLLYNKFKKAKLDAGKLEDETARLMEDEDITDKKGIYSYLLTGEEKHLSIRAFTPKQKREAYERQNGMCPRCDRHFKIEEMDGDHIRPWHEGGRTISENCQMLCKGCNRKKSGK